MSILHCPENNLLQLSSLAVASSELGFQWRQASKIAKQAKVRLQMPKRTSLPHEALLRGFALWLYFTGGCHFALRHLKWTTLQGRSSTALKLVKLSWPGPTKNAPSQCARRAPGMPPRGPCTSHLPEYLDLTGPDEQQLAILASAPISSALVHKPARSQPLFFLLFCRAGPLVSLATWHAGTMSL